MHNKYWTAFKRSYRTLRFELLCHLCSLYGMVKTKLFFNKSAINKLEIGIGNSPVKHGFISCDFNLSTDYPYDLRLGLPFPDNSIDYIYAEHVLEHFDYSGLMNLIKDCYRVLKPKGVFSVSVPDAAIYVKAYNNVDEFDRKKYCLYEFGLPYKSKIDYLNYIFYMDGHHRYMFDAQNLLAALKSGGFAEPRMREFDPELDQEARRYESIYAECIKLD